MTIGELIDALQKYPTGTEVSLYVGKCCDVQPIHKIHYQTRDRDDPAFLVLVDETQQICVPGRCNCT
jgi:hypothetical protein